MIHVIQKKFNWRANRLKMIGVLTALLGLSAIVILLSGPYKAVPLEISILEFRATKGFTSGIYIYSAGPDFSPPEITYLVCRVTIVCNAKNKGPVRCSPGRFRLITKDKSSGGQSLRFWKEHHPKEIRPVPDALLFPGKEVTGDLVFEVTKGTVPLRIEYSPPKGAEMITHPKGMIG